MKEEKTLISFLQIVGVLLGLAIFTSTIVIPIFGRIFARCETKNLQAVELRDVSVDEGISSHIDYYIRFENGDVVKVDMPRTVAEYMDGKIYQVKTCEGYEPSVVE